MINDDDINHFLSIDSGWCHQPSNTKPSFADSSGVSICYIIFRWSQEILENCDQSVLYWVVGDLWTAFMKEKRYQRRGIRMFAHMWERLMSCWGSLSNTGWRVQWEICCLLICSGQVLCQRGSGSGYSTFLSTFLRNSQALKRAPVAQPALPWWRHSLISPLSVMSQLLISWTVPLKPADPSDPFPAMPWPLSLLLKSMVIIIRHLSRGAGRLAFKAFSSLHPAHSRLEIMVGTRSFAGRLSELCSWDCLRSSVSSFIYLTPDLRQLFQIFESRSFVSNIYVSWIISIHKNRMYF